MCSTTSVKDDGQICEDQGNINEVTTNTTGLGSAKVSMDLWTPRPRFLVSKVLYAIKSP